MNYKTLLRCCLGKAVLLVGAFAGDAGAQAQAPDYLQNFVYPRNGTSSGDEIFVLYAENCGRPHVDRERAATVSPRSGDLVVVDLYLVDAESPICPAVFLPDTLQAVSIGRLPRGVYNIGRRLHVRPFAGGEYRLVLETYDALVIGDAPNPAASGTWFDVSAPGEGMVLNLLPAAEGEEANQALIAVFTRRSSGEHLWLTGIGRFVNATLTVALRSSSSEASPVSATAVFTHTGCGEGRLRISDGPALRFPNGEARLTQLTGTRGVPECRPPATRPDGLP